MLTGKVGGNDREGKNFVPIAAAKHSLAGRMQLVDWGAQPPRLLFGAPRAERGRCDKY